MNIIIRAIASGGQGTVINSTDEALACLNVLDGHIQETISELSRLGLVERDFSLDRSSELAVA